MHKPYFSEINNLINYIKKSDFAGMFIQKLYKQLE